MSLKEFIEVERKIHENDDDLLIASFRTELTEIADNYQNNSAIVQEDYQTDSID